MSSVGRTNLPSHHLNGPSVIPAAHILGVAGPRDPRTEPFYVTGSWAGPTPPSVSYPTGEYLGVQTKDFYLLQVQYVVSMSQTTTAGNAAIVPPTGWVLHNAFLGIGGWTPPFIQSKARVTAVFVKSGLNPDSEVQVPSAYKVGTGPETPFTTLSGSYALLKVPDILSYTLHGAPGTTAHFLVGGSREVTDIVTDNFNHTTDAFSRRVIYANAGKAEVTGVGSLFEGSAVNINPFPESYGLQARDYLAYTTENQVVNSEWDLWSGALSDYSDPPEYPGGYHIADIRLTVDQNTTATGFIRKTVAASAGPVSLHRL